MVCIKTTVAALAVAIGVPSMAIAAPATPIENLGIEERSANITARELDYGFLMMAGKHCALPDGKADVAVRNNDPGNSWIPGACYPLSGGLKIQSGLSWAVTKGYAIQMYQDPYCEQLKWEIPGTGGCVTGVPAGWFDLRMYV